MQYKSENYSGMLDAGKKIYQSEGMAGLYRGFWISSVQIVSGVFYISTYEGVRHLISRMGAGDRMKALVGGGCASLVGQTIIVPFDVISQHVMVLGMKTSNNKGDLNPLGIIVDKKKGKFNISIEIAKEIFRKDGFKGYYRGYTASLLAYVPNSAMWWVFYHTYQGIIFQIFLILKNPLTNHINSKF